MGLRNHPTIGTQVRGLEDLEVVAKPAELPKVLFEVFGRNGKEAGDSLPLKNVELTRDTERYMKIYLKEVRHHFLADGTFEETYKKFKMVRC